MPKLELSMSCGDYEILRALKDGRVTAEGIELTVLTRDRDRLFSLRRREECDIAEFTVTHHAFLAEQNYPYVALPVYPNRRFRYGFVFVRGATKSGGEGVTWLRGRSVGLGGYRSSTPVWMRGIITEHHSIMDRTIDWVGGSDWTLKGRERHWSDRSLEQKLLDGEIDALISPTFPEGLLDGSGRVTRLFDQYVDLDLSYYRATGIFPIQHVLTIRRALIERHPWIASNIARACQEAKVIALRRVRDPRVLPMPLFQPAWEQQESVFGGDPWEYGLGEKNTKTLTTVLRYAVEQGVVSRALDIAELFIDVPMDVFADPSRGF